MHRTSRSRPARRRPAPAPIRGASSEARGGLALLLSAADEDHVAVGNVVEHADPAVEVLLMYSVTAPGQPGRHWQAEPEDTDARCMLLGLGALGDDGGARNAVVFADPPERALHPPRAPAPTPALRTS